MSWGRLNNDAALINLILFKSGHFLGVELTSYASLDDATNCRAPHQSVQLTPPVAPLNPDLVLQPFPPLEHVEVTKSDLSPLDVGGHHWIKLCILCGASNGDDYAILQWDDGNDAFVCHLLTVNLRFSPLNHPMALAVRPLDLWQLDCPSVAEWVLLSGRDGSPSYVGQAMTYVLIEEFGENLQWVGNPIPGHPQSLTFDDQLMVTLIDDRGTRPRTQYARLFPPDQIRPVSDANLASRRAYVQWYPIQRHENNHDPINMDRGVRRLYGYLDWVGRNAPGRVRRAMIVSHAIVRGPTHFSDNGEQTDFTAGQFTVTALAAFSADASFHVTGCNSNTSTVRNGNSLIARQMVAKLEGNLRARIRLNEGLTRLHALLVELRGYLLSSQPNANLAPDTEQLARDIVAALFDDHPSHAGIARWRIPDATEGALSSQDAVYSGRDGELIQNQRNFATHVTNLKAFGNRADNTEPQVADATTEVNWLLERCAWARVGALQVDGRSISHYLTDVNTLLSAGVHYVAAFAHFASGNGRGDIRAFGGNPGQDGQHLTVTITVDNGLGNTASLNNTMVTAYTRAASWSRHNRPWLLALYRRYGLDEDDVYGYFRYDGRLNVAGAFIGSTGPGTESGCDYTTLNP